MSGTFKTVLKALLNCDKLPGKAKDILKTTNKSYEDLNKNDAQELWILLHNFIKETSDLEDITHDKDVLECYKCILNLINLAIDSTKDLTGIFHDHSNLLKTILVFQKLYKVNIDNKFKYEIIKVCSNFWKIILAYSVNGFENPMDNEDVIVNSFVFTFDYIFETIPITKKKLDMKTLSSLLWEYCKVVSTLSIKKGINNMVELLEKTINNSLFLETEPGKMIFADIFTTSQQLFLKFHQLVKKTLVKANKLVASALGDIYFISWINSNSSMKEVIEEQGMFEIISKAFTFQRTGLYFRTYSNVLIFLQSMQKHRKHLIFSKVITKLYTPVIWRNLSCEYGYVRLNAIEVLARAYPLEKRGEGREVSSRFLLKQQNAFLDLLIDACPQIRIAAIKGICSCMQYFWDSFNEELIRKFFNAFILLMNDSVFEVRRALFYYYCQLIDEKKSHVYFKHPIFMTKMKNALNDDNEKVRRAFIHFLLKIKKIDGESENTDKTDKINFAKIVNLKDIAGALANEDEQNILLLVDLIFDNFIGNKVQDRNISLLRIMLFYKINPNALRKLMLHSEKQLSFYDACQFIQSLLKTIYQTLQKKGNLLNNTDKENNSPVKRVKIDVESEDESEISQSSSVSSEDNERMNVCCILDCVNSLMILHRNELIDECNNQIMKDIQDSCVKCLIKVFKLYKMDDAYYSALSLASLFPVSKFSAHVSLPSAAISTLKQLPLDLKNSEEEIDMRKVNCLVHTLCMWKRGYEILQFVSVWFDECFKTINLNETQYPESTLKIGKRVRFKLDVEDCKPITGVLLINSMLNNLQTQKTLLSSDVNRKNIYDLISYLHRVKPSIEKRISSDNILSKLLSDEVLVELLQLHIHLHIIYHSEENNSNIDEIITYQTSILDWVINNLLIHDLHLKNETTIIFAAKIINTVNNIILNVCLMAFVNKEYLDNLFIFFTAIIQNHLSPRILISMIETLISVAKYFNHLKIMNNLENDPSIIANCTCSILSIFSESKFDEERFQSIIGTPTKFRKNLNMLIWEIYKISLVDFKQVLIILIETIVQIIANHIREIEEVDMIEHLTDIPFGAYQLALVILNNAQLKKMFSSSAVAIFSSNVYKNDSVLLISAISYVYTLSFQLSKTKKIEIEPVVKLLYTILMEHDKTTTLLGDQCNITCSKGDQGGSILETSEFSNEKMDFRQKGRNILIATAKQLCITLT